MVQPRLDWIDRHWRRQRFAAVENALSRFEQVIPGKFAADFIEQVHAAPERIWTLRVSAAAVILNVEVLYAKHVYTYPLEPRSVATGAKSAARRAGT